MIAVAVNVYLVAVIVMVCGCRLFWPSLYYRLINE